MTSMVKFNLARPHPMRLALALVLLASAASASAQLYSWKDDKGVTHFSDQPPPEPAKGAGKGSKAGNVAVKDVARGASGPDLPYVLGEAVRRNPVVLYTSAACPACDSGRTLLQQRGVPFSEKLVTPNDDQEKLKAAGVGTSLPVLAVGSSRQVGFDQAAWQEALTAASYPAQSRLPANYRQGAATAAAPVVPAPAREAAAKPETPARKPPPQNAPPGFQF